MAEAYPPSVSSGASSSDHSDDWLEPDAYDENEDDEQETLQIVSLIDDRVFTDAPAMLAYVKEKSGLDFLAMRDQLGLDFHGCVKLINFVRKRVADKAEVPKEISAEDLADDGLLRPVLEDDALILCLDELPQAGETGAASGRGTATGKEGQATAPQVDELLQKNARLQEELDQLAKQFGNYRLAVQQTLDQRWGTEEPEGKGSKGSEEEERDPSAYYFESYAHNDIHETMLKDAVRTDAYRDFIYNNKDLFAGKVVLDIGCGTGILSMFCAKADAARVLAVDNSAILDKARENIFNNKLDHVITCIRGRIEDVKLPVDKVDIIVSEWMGYCLLYEAMLPSVFFARDRYLKPDGLLVPSHSSMWIAPVSDGEYVTDRISFWDDVYGFDMRAMKEGIYTDCRVEVIPGDTLCGTPYAFRMLDLHTAKTEDLVFDAKWASTISDKADGLDGFLVWFDCFFAERRDEKIEDQVTAKEWVAAGGPERVAFTTDPRATPTHWKQGLLLIDGKKAREVAAAPGTKLVGEIQYATPEDHARGLNIKVTWGVEGGDKRDQTWLLH